MRALRILAGGAVLLLASPAFAETAPPPTANPIPVDSYNPRHLPVVQTPTNKVKNNIGQTVQRACLRSGRGAAACTAIAIGAGGAGYGRFMERSWSDIAWSIGTGALQGAATNAALGCAIGGVTGAGAGGVGAIPGCGVGALFGAVTGGLIGAVGGVINLTADGSVQLQTSNGAVQGTDTQASVIQPNGMAHYFAFGNSDVQSRMAAFNLIGVNKTFLCSGSVYAPGASGAYSECMFLVVNQRPESQGGFGDPYGVIRSDDQFQLPLWRFCDGYYRPKNCLANVPKYSLGHNNGFPSNAQFRVMPTYTDGSSVVMISRGLGTYTSPPSVPTQVSQPIPQVPYWASGFAPNIKPEAMGKPVADPVVAGVANGSLREYARQTGQNLDDIVVNSDDVRAVATSDPNNQILLQDLYRPVAAHGAGGGTAENPLAEPQTVIVANPSTGAAGQQTGTAVNPTITREEADKDLELEVGIPIGNPIQPVIDFLSGPLAPFISPTFQSVQGQCPIWEVDMRQWFGSLLDKDLRGNAVTQTSAHAEARTFLQWNSKPVCDFLDAHYQLIQLFCSILIVVAGFMRFFDNS